MKMNLVLELMDVPGQLVSVLEPIGSLGANLVTVIHKREFKNERGMVPVHLTIEGERENLFNVIQKFEDLGFSIVEIDGVVKKEMVSTILYGHVVDNDVRDTMDKINALKGVSVVGFDIKLDGEKESTALITVETDYGKKHYVFDKIKEIADEKNLLMINEV